MTTGVAAERPQTRALQGRVAMVTGGSRGIGAAVARAFAAAGAHVAVAARDSDALRQIAEQVEGVGVRALPIVADVTDPDAVEALVAQVVGEFGQLDFAVNNAGGGFAGKASLADVELDAFVRSIELNLTSVFYSVKYEVAAMIAGGGGAIVNISSGAGFRASPGMGAYVIAKHGLHGLTKVAALDYAEQRVRVNAIAPGPVLAGPLASASQDHRALARRSVPMRQLGQPEDVAEAAVWLCSDAARFVTGITIPVDGGQLAGVG